MVQLFPGVSVGWSERLSDRGLTIPKAKESVKDWREWRRIVGATQMIQGEAGCMKQFIYLVVDFTGVAPDIKQLKLWMFLICFALGFDSSEG